MANNYVVSGNQVTLAPEGALRVEHSIPAGIYTLQFSPMAPPSLVRAADFKLPEKLYGNTQQLCDRICYTFNDRKANTGVLLHGAKGSGKSLLAKKVSMTMLEQGVSTILIPPTDLSPATVEFLATVDCPCVVMFDEIDKVGGSDECDAKQTINCLLGLFDGTASTHHLYLLTANDEHRISPQLLNRPGRIYYNLEFGGVEQQAVEEYCAEKLRRPEWTKEVIRISCTIRQFSFDMLQAIVEECNRYDVEPTKACEFLNVSPDMSGLFRISVVHRRTGLPLEVTKGTEFSNIYFNAKDNTTAIEVLDPERGEQCLRLSHSEEAEELKLSKQINGDMWRQACRHHFYIYDTEYKEITKNGDLIYEVEDYLIKCTPVQFEHRMSF